MLSNIRNEFPALSRVHNGRPLVYLDGPAGTQVPTAVIDAVSHYYKNTNANTHGAFITAEETSHLLEDVRGKVASFLGAEGAHTISIGQNMSTLNFSLSYAIGNMLQPGDEILITESDHESNRAPWLALRNKGVIVREVKLKDSTTLDYEDFQEKLTERTRLVAVGLAVNIFGTINDIARIRKMTHQAGAWLLVDAVHAAPHMPIDVQSIGCDFLLCSAYKFYGPHVGLLYSKPGLLDRMPTYRLRTSNQRAPYSIETGTLNHAAIAGTGAAIDFIASYGLGNSYEEQLKDAMKKMEENEHRLFKQLYQNLAALPGLEIYGPGMEATGRTPTLSFMIEGKKASDVCSYLASKSICAWSGHFYAIRAAEVLGLLEKGGLTRMGIVAYNTAEEITYTSEMMEKFVKK